MSLASIIFILYYTDADISWELISRVNGWFLLLAVAIAHRCTLSVRSSRGRRESVSREHRRHAATPPRMLRYRRPARNAAA